jgi:hypothetical protein
VLLLPCKSSTQPAFCASAVEPPPVDHCNATAHNSTPQMAQTDNGMHVQLPLH